MLLGLFRTPLYLKDHTYLSYPFPRRYLVPFAISLISHPSPLTSDHGPNTPTGLSGLETTVPSGLKPSTPPNVAVTVNPSACCAARVNLASTSGRTESVKFSCGRTKWRT